MRVSNISFVNFTGYVTGSRTAQISCSTRKPCSNIEMRDIRLRPGKTAAVGGAQGTCKYVEKGSVKGMTGSGC